jgi:hypothetical protein
MTNGIIAGRPQTAPNPGQLSFLEQPEFDTKHGRAFRAFHAENPDVFEELVGLVRHAYNQGRPRIGMGMLFEVLRWNRIAGTRGEEFKLNNNYRAYYTRLITLTHPHLGALLTRRESMADSENYQEAAA